MGINLQEIANKLDEKYKVLLESRFRQLNSRQHYINLFIGILFLGGCVGIGIVVFIIAPAKDNSCGIHSKQCEATVNSITKSSATMNCTLIIDSSKINEFEQTPNECFEHFMVLNQIGNRSLLLSILISTSVGLPLFIFSLTGLYDTYAKKQVILQLWPIYLFNKISSFYYYLCFFSLFAAQVFYTIAFYYLSQKYYYYMMLFFFLVGFVAYMAYRFYQNYSNLFFLIAAQNNPLENFFRQSMKITSANPIFSTQQKLKSSKSQLENQQIDYDQY